jgi:hypothetical protein
MLELVFEKRGVGEVDGVAGIAFGSAFIQANAVHDYKYDRTGYGTSGAV